MLAPPDGLTAATVAFGLEGEETYETSKWLMRALQLGAAGQRTNSSTIPMLITSVRYANLCRIPGRVLGHAVPLLYTQGLPQLLGLLHHTQSTATR